MITILKIIINCAVKQVRCINNDYFPSSLTIGKIYDVVYHQPFRSTPSLYKLVDDDDDGYTWTYNEDLFEDYNKLRCNETN